MTQPDSGSRGTRHDGALRRRVLAAFLALALVPLFGSSALGYLRSRSIVEDLVGRYLDGMAGIQASHVQDRLDQRILYLQAVASGNRFLQAAAERGSPGATSGMAEAADPEAVAVYLNRKLEEATHFETLSLHRLDGTLLASSHDSPAPHDWQPLEGRQATLVWDADPEHPPTLLFAVPVRSEAGEPEAYLSATMPFARGPEFLDIPPHVAGAIESFIVDGEGRPIFVSHPHGHGAYDQPITSPLVGLPSGTHARYRDREGVEVIGASAALSRYGWLFVTEVPASDALKDLGRLRTLSLLLGAALAMLVLTAGWLMAGSIVAPIHRLVGAVRRLGAGDLDIRVPDPGADEIGELSEAFNEMASAMADDRARIAGLHRREIERAQQLATVGELASGVAHEIKNPVVGISNGLDLVLRRVNDPSLTAITDEMRRQLKRIEGAVRDLLSFARPPEPDIAPASVNRVVERALTLVAPAAGKQRVRMELRLLEGLPAIDADAELLGQAVVNLLMNAVQVSGKGQAVVVGTSQEGQSLMISVEDQGPGLTAGEMDQVFKPFYTTRHSGSGLGLPISRGIIERHGGTLRVLSEPGKGARFVISLPIGSREAPGPGDADA